MENSGEHALVYDKENLRVLFTQKERFFSCLLSELSRSLSRAVSLQTTPAYKSRIKDFASYYSKLVRLKPPYISPLPPLTDMLGVRVVCAFLEDLNTVEQQICGAYTVLEIERKGSDKTFREFGYESIHLLVKIPGDILRKAAAAAGPESGEFPEEWLAALVCEVQIRTILQDAWAEVEHELVYKSEFSPFDLPLRRKLSSINASLTLADIIFQEIRDYQNKLNREIGFRRNTFYSKTDTLSRTVTGEEYAPQQTPQTFPVQAAPSPFIRGTIDDLVLEAIHAHNKADFDKAIGIYTKIIEFVPAPADAALAVIYKHRGMAYFAQSKYGEALADFEQSCRLAPQNFRSLYYMGIVYCIQERYPEAIGAFAESLAINNYQAHVHYRMAAAKFMHKEYQDALRHLDDAKKLGLDDADTRALRARLVEKFDMRV